VTERERGEGKSERGGDSEKGKRRGERAKRKVGETAWSVYRGATVTWYRTATRALIPPGGPGARAWDGARAAVE